MKISGVDRCGCLIQSARLESTGPPIVPFSHPFHCAPPTRRFRARTIGCDSNQANPIRSRRVPILASSSFRSPFSPSVSVPPLGPLPSAPDVFVLPQSFDSLFLRREPLPRERFAAEGYSYRFPGAFRPFQPLPPPPPPPPFSAAPGSFFFLSVPAASLGRPLPSQLDLSARNSVRATPLENRAGHGGQPSAPQRTLAAVSSISRVGSIREHFAEGSMGLVSGRPFFDHGNWKDRSRVSGETVSLPVQRVKAYNAPRSDTISTRELVETSIVISFSDREFPVTVADRPLHRCARLGQRGR